MAYSYNVTVSSSNDEDEVGVKRQPRVINKQINRFEPLDDVDFSMRFRLSKNN